LFVHLAQLIPVVKSFRFVIHLLITISPTIVAMPAPLTAPLVRTKLIVHPFCVLLAIQQLGLMPLI
jgi:hypothetical protein